MIDESTNRILYVADNLRVMRGIESESIDLIATDPPFNSKRSFNAPLGSRAAKQKFEDRWRWDEVTDEWHDVIAADHPAIKELIEAAVTIEGGTIEPNGKVNIGVTDSMAAFLAWMAPRIVEMRRILKPTGSLYMHCDDAANSYLRLLLDAVFGRNRFRNEIVWQRTSGHNNTAQGNKQFGRVLDSILFYTASANWTWHPQFTEYDSEYVERMYRHKDPDGRRYQTDNLTAAKPGGDTLYEWRVKRLSAGGVWMADLSDEWLEPQEGWEY